MFEKESTATRKKNGIKRRKMENNGMPSAKAVAAQTENLVTAAVLISLFVALAIMMATVPMARLEAQAQTALFITAEMGAPLI